MIPSTSLALAALFTALSLAPAGPAQAELQPRGSGMVYDSTLDITWLSDMAHARTSGVDADGLMSWSEARLWADALVFGGVDDWRLPTLDPSDSTCSRVDVIPGFPPQHLGFGCTGGELSHLFVVDFGNRGGESVFDATGDTAEQRANLALFSNVPDGIVWSAVRYDPRPVEAWVFVTFTGSQYHLSQEFFGLSAVAVRSGDVAAVPEPQALALWLSGLGAVALVARRRPG
jgi:hypothetical protein